MSKTQNALPLRERACGVQLLEEPPAPCSGAHRHRPH